MTQRFAWPDDRRAAISLTYDDCLPCHHETVAPLLRDSGISATFYIPASSDHLWNAPEQWRGVAAMGHELGNHTCFHPCRHNTESRKWVDHGFDLAAYTLRRWQREVDLCNRVLASFDGQTRRTYGNTCHDETFGTGPSEQSLRPAMLERFVAARGPCPGTFADPATCDLAGIGCAGGDKRPAAQLIAQAEEAIAAGAWLIWCMHGVGQGTHNHFIDAGEHRALVKWLAERSGTVWCAPVRDVATHVAAARGGTAAQ